MTGALSNFLIYSKASLSLVPHFLDLPVHVRSHKGLDIVENPGREFGTESPLGDLQPLSREHFSHVLQALGSNDTLFTVMGHPMLFKLCVLLCQGFIMFLMVTANYSHTVMQVVSAGAILQHLPFSG